MTSDPNTEPSLVPDSEPDSVPDSGIVDPDVEPEQTGAPSTDTPTTDVASAPALQPRDGGGESDMLT